jgi:hypothetical protein
MSNKKGYVPLETIYSRGETGILVQLISANSHFQDVPWAIRQVWEKHNEKVVLPRTWLHDKVVLLHKVRPNINKK